MSGRACSVCAHPELVAIQAAVGTVPLVDVASRFQVSKSAVHRHAQKCMRKETPGTRKPVREGNLPGHNLGKSRSRPVTGRCPACSQLTGEGNESLKPEDITRRAERVLYIAEGIASQAQASQDSRLALQAVDRCQKSLHELALYAGMVKQDVTLTVQTKSIYDSWSPEALRTLGKCSDMIEAGLLDMKALEGLEKQKPLALPRAVGAEVVN